MSADLATVEGVDELCGAANGRAIDARLVNAGRGLGKAFLDQRWDEARRVIDTNITGTVYPLHKVGNEMRTRGGGRVLISRSIAGFMPDTFQAIDLAEMHCSAAEPGSAEKS